MECKDSVQEGAKGKFCPECGDIVIGHPNKIFCCVECKERYHDRNGAPHVKRALLPDITLEQLRHFMTYQPETGLFIWNVRCGRATKGTIAGTVQSKGYIYINVLRRIYGAHRLAWLWHYGNLPSGWLDHKNGNRQDNRIENLRLATPSENAHSSRRIAPESGSRGVRKEGNSWRASIGFLGEYRNLGSFPTKEEAQAAFLRASKDLYGQFSVAHLSNDAERDGVSLKPYTSSQPASEAGKLSTDEVL